MKIWQRDFTGAGGLFSVLFDARYGETQTDHFVDSLKLFKIGYSWGGTHSLCGPVPHRHNAQSLARAGATGALQHRPGKSAGSDHRHRAGADPAIKPLCRRIARSKITQALQHQRRLRFDQQQFGVCRPDKTLRNLMLHKTDKSVEVSLRIQQPDRLWYDIQAEPRSASRTILPAFPDHPATR